MKSLSEKILCGNYGGKLHLKTDDVKDAIKRETELIVKLHNGFLTWSEFEYLRRKLLGDKLIK